MTGRSGISTGTCTAAAAKAAALAVLGEAPARVEVALPSGERIEVAVLEARRLDHATGVATVVKDAGDDADVTDGAHVVVEVRRGGEGVRFVAGEGVGTVTMPGLQLAVGEPAINPAPRRQIASALAEVLGQEVGATVTVSIPGGEALAAKTFNPRLGVRGGLSVLGTSGRVEPKSAEAWARSLVPQLDVAVAAGHREVWLVPGGVGERAAVGLFGAPVRAVVQTANFVGELLSACAEAGVERVMLVGHVGKLAKVAAGVFDTHSRAGDARLETIAALAAAQGAPGPLVARLLGLPTAQAAVALLTEAGLERTWTALAERAARRASVLAGLPVECAVLGYDDAVLGATKALAERLPAGDVSCDSGEAGRADTAETATAGTHGCERPSVSVVGVGPGEESLLTPAAWAAIAAAEVVLGGARQLDVLAPASAERIVLGADVAAAFAAARERLERGRRLVVLASGDPGCSGVLATARRLLPEADFEVVVGVSSVQLAAARLGVCWDGAAVESAHGRGVEGVVSAVKRNARVFALADAVSSPQTIASALRAEGLGGARVSVCERLGLDGERVTRGTCEEIASGEFVGLSVVLIEREDCDA